jgi:predicted DNA-binding transcriptional regulator AlpA
MLVYEIQKPDVQSSVLFERPNTAQVAMLRLPQVLLLLPFSRSHWWKLVKERRAPQPVKYGSITMWRKADILEFIEKINKGEEYQPR